MMRLSRGLPWASTKLSRKSGTMSSVPQPICTSPAAYASRICDRVVDQDQIDLEWLAIGPFPFLARLEAVVGQHDGRPAGPDVEREPDGVVHERLVSGGSLHGRQLLGRLEVVFLDGGRAGGVGRLGGLIEAKILGLNLARLWSLCFFPGGGGFGATMSLR